MTWATFFVRDQRHRLISWWTLGAMGQPWFVGGRVCGWVWVKGGERAIHSFQSSPATVRVLLKDKNHTTGFLCTETHGPAKRSVRHPRFLSRIPCILVIDCSISVVCSVWVSRIGLPSKSAFRQGGSIFEQAKSGRIVQPLRPHKKNWGTPKSPVSTFSSSQPQESGQPTHSPPGCQQSTFTSRTCSNSPTLSPLSSSPSLLLSSSLLSRINWRNVKRRGSGNNRNSKRKRTLPRRKRLPSLLHQNQEHSLFPPRKCSLPPSSFRL